MKLLDAVHGRRSIRQFVPEPVDGPTVRMILAAGMAAPSAGSEQPWHFIVIREQTPEGRW